MASLGTGMPRGGARAAATGGRGRGRGSGRRKRDTSRESDEYIPPSMRAAEKKRAREVAQFQAELSDSSDEEQDEQENIDAPRQEDDEVDNEDEVNNFIDQVFPLMDFAQVEAEDDPDAVDPDTQTQVDAAAGPHQLENVEAMYPPFFTEMAQLEPVEPRPDTVPEEQRGGLPEDDEQTVEEVNKEVEFMRPTEHGTNEEQMEGGLEPTRIVQEDVRTEEPPQVPELIGPTQGPVNFGEQFPDPPYNGPTFAEPSPPRIIPRVEFVSGMSKAPHFPQQPVARQNEDGSLELECYVDANPKPEIKWFYDNKEVKQDGRFSLKLDNRGSDQYSAILTIKDLADSDAGAYRCAIVNPHGKGNANFNLKLTGFSSPTFVEKPQISSRDDGQVMVMEFRAKSILKPVFVWSKGDEIVSPSDRIQVVLREEPNQIYYSALEIKDPTKEKDAGQFVCTAKNDSGKLTATFTVKFEVPQGAPTFTRKPQILQKTSDSGDPAIVFDIGYQADRNPEVIWINPKGKKMKESSRIKFGTSSDGGSNTFTATLELKNYKAKDSGTYTCNIKNDAGEANVELTLNIEGPMDDGAEGDSDA